MTLPIWTYSFAQHPYLQFAPLDQNPDIGSQILVHVNHVPHTWWAIRFLWLVSEQSEGIYGVEQPTKNRMLGDHMGGILLAQFHESSNLLWICHFCSLSRLAWFKGILPMAPISTASCCLAVKCRFRLVPIGRIRCGKMCVKVINP